jgi:hypothetical protein
VNAREELELAAAIAAALLPDVFEELDATKAHQVARAWAEAILNDPAVVSAVDAYVSAEKAAAWDEGYDDGHQDARAVQATYPAPTPNPYRAGSPQ